MTTKTIQYIGEHTGWQLAGESFIYLALAGSVLSFLAYLIFNITNKGLWHSVARTAYLIHLLGLVGAGFVLFYLLFGLHYEFAYVWEHTASYLKTKYIISAFWAGQEGSFLLWALLEGILGMIALYTSGKQERYVMPVVALGQFFLITMVWGVKIGGFVLGQSPFVFLREKAVNAGAEFFQDPHYLQNIADGNGINPLLENIWMVTHPPLLFLGYSAALIPFAYVMSALWNSDFKSWLKPAFPWTIFAMISLGGGILLGGAWAYESLTFGGFWAWDPVENASLIPWLFIVAGFHMMILNKKRNHSYGLSFMMIIMGYVFVVYASYLTRSGVLGETSAHAFGNNGLSAQMIIIIVVTMLSALLLYIKNLRKFPQGEKDLIFSREFWMYLGSLVLVLAAFQIFTATSIPVFNKLFGSAIAPPQDRVAFYNRWQLPFAIVLVFLMAGSLLLRYGKNGAADTNKRFMLSAGIAAVLFVAELPLFKVSGWAFLVFMYFLNFSVVSAIQLLIKQKINRYTLANSLSHLGFTIFLLGVLVAFSNAEIISSNTSPYNLGDEQANRENQVLIKKKPEVLGSYRVVYDSMYVEKNYLHYFVKFYDKDDVELKEERFTIHPDININSRMGNVYNPSTHHSISKDVFTYITYANLEADQQQRTMNTIYDGEIQMLDTINLRTSRLIFKGIHVVGEAREATVDNINIQADFVQYTSMTDSATYHCQYRIKNGMVNYEDAMLPDGMILRFAQVLPEHDKIKLQIFKKRLHYIVIKSTVFPWISLLMVGGVLMFAGLFLSLWRHVRP